MDLWNVKNLIPPPVTNAKARTKEIDIKLLQAVAKDAVNFYESQSHLHTEAALVSRLAYRMKMKFRSAKDFKALEKLSRALRVYLHMGVPALFKTLLRSVPETYKVDSTHVLTKNMLDYVLVRLQGLGKLLCRIVDTCRILAELTIQRLRLGHFWKVALIVFAATSRIFVIAKTLCKRTCEIYDNLLPFSGTLGNVGTTWLLEGYSFPQDLEEWLGLEWLNSESRVIEVPDDEPLMSYFRLMEDSDDDVEFCDEYILVQDETFGGEKCEEVDSNSLIVVDDDEDIGEVFNVSDLESSIEVAPEHVSQRENKRRLDCVELSGLNEDDVAPSKFKIDTSNVISLIDSPSPNKVKKKRKGKSRNVGALQFHDRRESQGLLKQSVKTILSGTNSDSPNKLKKKRRRKISANNSVLILSGTNSDSPKKIKKKRRRKISANNSVLMTPIKQNKINKRRKRKKAQKESCKENKAHLVKKLLRSK